jgi:hypothetical protein
MSLRDAGVNESVTRLGFRLDNIESGMDRNGMRSESASAQAHATVSLTRAVLLLTEVLDVRLRVLAEGRADYGSGAIDRDEVRDE